MAEEITKVLSSWGLGRYSGVVSLCACLVPILFCRHLFLGTAAGRIVDGCFVWSGMVSLVSSYNDDDFFIEVIFDLINSLTQKLRKGSKSCPVYYLFCVALNDIVPIKNKPVQ